MATKEGFVRTTLHVENDYRVGQEGEFLLFDAFFNPIETVKGKIVKLMDGKDSLYAILQTERGMRPARLARSAIRPE